MFCGVGNRCVEQQADDRLAADIFDADAYTGRIESHKLNGTSRGSSGPGAYGLRIGAEQDWVRKSDVDRESGLESDPWKWPSAIGTRRRLVT